MKSRTVRRKSSTVKFYNRNPFPKENGPCWCCVLRAERAPPATMARGAAVSPLAKLRLGLSNNLRVLPSHLWPSLVPTGSHPVDRFIHTLSKNSQAPIRIVKCDALAVTAHFPPVLHHSPAGTSTISLYSVLYWTLLFSLYLCHVEVNFSYPGRMLVCLQSALKGSGSQER